MRTISCKLEDLKNMTLHIGYEGENNYTSIRIDAGSVFAQYPEAEASMKVLPPKGNIYPVLLTREDNIVIWNVSDSDTASNGNGEIQLTFTENTVVVKSCKAKTLVHRSLNATGPAPDPLQDFIDRAEEVVQEAENAATEAAEAAEHAPIIGQDGYWYRWDAEAGEYVRTGTKAQGPQGTPGEPGAPGDPTQLIDDTSGEGQTGKTWSADKLHTELGSVKNSIHQMQPAATASDIGKALTVKTVDDGKPTSFEYKNVTVDPEDIAEAVDDWLDENITNPDSPPLDRSLSSSSSAAPADIMGELMEHEAYEKDSTETETEYEPITESQTIASNRIRINTYNNVVITSPTTTTLKIYPVVNGKTYKVRSSCNNTTERPCYVVANDLVTSGQVAVNGSYDYSVGTNESQTEETKEFTAARTGYVYINASDNTCGLWLKKEVIPTVKKYYMDEVRNDIFDTKCDVGILNDTVFRTKIDSSSAITKSVPRNAEKIARVTSIADSVTYVKSIISRNLADKGSVGDVEIDTSGTEKKGIKTVKLMPGSYYIDLGNMGSYTMVKAVQNGVFSTELYKSQFPMKYSITDPDGGYFVVYASSIANLGDMSSLLIARLNDDETTVSYEAYEEKTYTPDTLAEDNRIEVVPYGLIEFVNGSNADVSSTVEYTVFGKDDDTTTRKNFIISPDGSKFLPMVKNDGTISCARVVPKKALFIGNSLTSGWQTFGEAATEHDNDFVGQFSAVVAEMDSDYTFNRKWSTQFEQKTSLEDAQTWVANNIDPMLSSDLDLIVIQLCENVVNNDSAVAVFPTSSLWLMQHLRTECPKARVVWMGVWFERRWVPTLLENTKKAGCEYIDIRPLYKPENVSVIGTVYKMDADFTKEYTVDSFTVDDGEITLNFTVDGKEYTATIPSYTSYTSSSDTSITVTGIYHVVSTYYASIHPGDEGFRKIANKLLFDLGISDSEEAIPADA